MINFIDEISWRKLLLHQAFILILTGILFGLEYITKPDCGWDGLFITYYYSFFCWNGSIAITFFCVRFIGSIEKTVLRVVINIISILIYILGVVYMSKEHFFPNSDIEFLIDYITCTTVTTIVCTVYLTLDYFKLYKEKVNETEALKRLQVENELKILSNQVNPHFLFNSLNTLMAIIPEDAQKAVHFTESFSKVYRYSLQNRNSDTVALKEEIDLINNYCYLLKIRFGENFQCDINIPERYNEAIIPPFVIQLLVENATKHNTISQLEPLELKIWIENDCLVAQNKINKKMNNHNGTGAGLENISQRVKYLTGRKLQVLSKDEYFKVSVPLIFAEDYESDYH